MTTSLTYTTLIDNLTGYLERKDAEFLAQCPTFINLAENRIATDMKQQGFQAVVTGSLPAAASMEKPSFWRQTISFSAKTPTGVRIPLYLRAYEFVQACYPTATTVGAPRYYADYNATHFALGPIPDAATYTFELLYYARLTPLDATTTVNWLTLNAPQALLAASMLEASLWIKNDSKIALWQAQYAAARDALLEENQDRLGDRNVKVARG